MCHIVVMHIDWNEAWIQELLLKTETWIIGAKNHSGIKEIVALVVVLDWRLPLWAIAERLEQRTVFHNFREVKYLQSYSNTCLSIYTIVGFWHVVKTFWHFSLATTADSQTNDAISHFSGSLLATLPLWFNLYSKPMLGMTLYYANYFHKILGCERSILPSSYHG